MSNNTTVAEYSDKKIEAKSAGQAAIVGSVSVYGNTSVDSTNVTVKPLNYGLQSARTASGITIARKTNEIEVGEEYSVQAYLLSAVTSDHPYPYGYADDNLVVWESSNPSVCRVKNGVLFGVSEGTTTITAYDLSKTVHESFTVSVVAESSLTYTDQEVLTLSDADIDDTDAETTTVAFQTILANAHTNGYKKVVFPANQVYHVSPVYGSIAIPTQMIVDFNGCTIQIEESSMTQTGYSMFCFSNCYKSEIQNAVIYGERMLISGTGDEDCQSISISGSCYQAGIRNCTISRSPGFNVGFRWTNLARVGYLLSSIEQGGIDDIGQNTPRNYSFRCSGYINLSRDEIIGEKFGLGNMQGDGGYLYMSARVYDIFFYDSNKEFLSSLKNCVQYYMYNRPENAEYARICYRWDEAPTAKEDDYNGIAHVYSFKIPTRCFIKNCVFEENYSTAINPNGADSLLIDGCLFRNNGYRDPASHIDWEDGRQNNKGHIVRNCTFVDGGSVTLVGADGTAIHNNTFDGCNLTIGSEVQNSRVWLNQFLGVKTTRITSKTDMVFSQNFGFDGASYSVRTPSESNSLSTSANIRMTENSF